MSEPFDLAAIRRENTERKARRDAATPGPWIITLGSGCNLMTAVQSEYAEDGHLTPIADCLVDWMLDRAPDDHRPNMKFIAMARGDQAAEIIDALLDVVRQKDEALAEVIAWLERLGVAADRQANQTERFPALQEAERADAKNYRARAAYLSKVLALTRDEKG